MKNLPYLVLSSAVLAALFAACGGGSSASVDIVGLPPAQQADAIADAICDQQVACGGVDIDCSFDPQTEQLDCIGTITDVDYATCVAEIRPEIFEDLDRCDLTPADQRIVQDCINAMLAQPCVSQSELDAYVTEIEAGNEPASLRPIPAACATLEDLFDCGPQ